jgi:hypothetical protein
VERRVGLERGFFEHGGPGRIRGMKSDHQARLLGHGGIAGSHRRVRGQHLAEVVPEPLRNDPLRPRRVWIRRDHLGGHAWRENVVPRDRLAVIRLAAVLVLAQRIDAHLVLHRDRVLPGLGCARREAAREDAAVVGRKADDLDEALRLLALPVRRNLPPGVAHAEPSVRTTLVKTSAICITQ